jgi:hypothetical protein
MKIQINIEKRHLLLLVAVIAIASIGIALAVMPTTAQNPGHTGDQIQCDKCITAANLNVGSGHLCIFSASCPDGWAASGKMAIPISNADGVSPCTNIGGTWGGPWSGKWYFCELNICCI